MSLDKKMFCGQDSLGQWLELNRIKVFEDETLLTSVAPFPPSDLMSNVSGLNAKRDFASHGCDIYQALSKASTMPLTDYSKILDFGCGCGRLARLFKNHPNQIYGCDIDSRHVEWMQNNLSYMQTTLTKIHPPLPYDDNMFDAIISISIFTHLTEQSQDEFLAELARITNTSSKLFITVHGERALKRATDDPQVCSMLNMDEQAFNQEKRDFHRGKYAFVLQQGHLTVNNNHWKERLNRFFGRRVIEDPFEYGISFTSEDYIRQHWSEWFDIEAIHKAAIHDFQDIVVLQIKK